MNAREGTSEHPLENPARRGSTGGGDGGDLVAAFARIQVGIGRMLAAR